MNPRSIRNDALDDGDLPRLIALLQFLRLIDIVLPHEIVSIVTYYKGRHV